MLFKNIIKDQNWKNSQTISIRWKFRKYPQGPLREATARCYAYLVKNYQKGNKAKQEIIIYLGGISLYKEWGDRKITGEKFYPFHKEVFKFRLKKQLEELKIPSREKNKILKSLSFKKVFILKKLLDK